MDTRTLIIVLLAGALFFGMMPYLAKYASFTIELIGMKNVLESERKAIVAKSVVSGALYAVGFALVAFITLGSWLLGLAATLAIGLAATAMAYVNFRFADRRDEFDPQPQVRPAKSVGARAWRIVLILLMIVTIAALIDLPVMFLGGVK